MFNISKKRIASVMSLVLAVAMMSAVIVATPKSVDTSDSELDLVAMEGNTAGIIDTVTDMQASAVLSASVENVNVNVVATSESTETTEDAETEVSTETTEVAETEDTTTTTVNAEWANKLMTTVEESLNVRAEASTEADIVGKLRAGDVAEITETLDGWYGITSGNVIGYVSADYCVIGDDAYALSLEVCTTYAQATEGGIRVRSIPSTDGNIMTVLGQDDTIECDLDAESVDGWVAVICDNETCYVSAEYVTVYTDYGEAVTLEEEQEAIAAAEAAEKQAQATQNAAVAASADDTTLLAALIQCEAGSECYEGKVAVGAVVVNRLRRGYSSSIYGVIYQSGQFPPAASGSVAAVVAAGPTSSCMEAAAQALSGYDNTGGATGFANVRTGRSGVVIGNHVFY